MKGKLIKRLMLVAALSIMGASLLTGCGKKDNDTQDDKDTKQEKEDEEGIVVDNAEDFLEAIEPGAVITIKKGTYNFTEDIEEILEDTSIKKWNKNHDYVKLNECLDGVEIVIYDVDGLTINGEKKKKTELQVEPRYADVLRFENCQDIEINSITIGHTVEQGSCEGDVLEFDDCEDINLVDLDLYGCGTYGVTSFDSKDLTIDSTTIHDCSYGAVWFARCEDFYVVDSNIENNEGYYLLDINNTNATFKNCNFYGNSFEWGVTGADNYNDLTFKNCSFGEDETISLNYGSFEGCTFDDSCEFVEVLDGPGSYIDFKETRVTDVQEFIEAIDSDTAILVEPGYYNISDYLNEQLEYYTVDEWNDNHAYVSISMEYDGPQLNIYDVTNLNIYGNGDAATDVAFYIDPRYSDVLHFNNCSYIYMSNMNMGHTSNGECIGNVIGLENTSSVTLCDMDLYGCGVYGVSGDYSSDIYVNECYIHDCEYGFASFYNCTGDISFTDCCLINSGGGLWGYDYSTVTLTNCYLGKNEGADVLENDNLKLDNCTFESDGAAQPDMGQDSTSMESIDMSQLSRDYFTAYKIVFADGSIMEVPYFEDDGDYVYMELSLTQDGKGYIYGYEDYNVTTNFTWSEENGWGNISAKKTSTLNGGMLFAYTDSFGNEEVEMDIAGYQIYFK